MAETAPPSVDPAPPGALRLFGSRVATATAFTELLASDGVVRGLIGPREVPRLWDRHVLNCGVVESLVPARARVLDVGSGAGLPGIVLAIARPDLDVTLVEPMQRRVTFLTEVVTRLRVSNVTVVAARAEALHGVRTAEVVTARALAPLSALLPLTLPLVAAGGALLAIKGRSAGEELRRAGRVLARWPGCTAEVVEVGADLVDPPTTVVRVQMPVARHERRA